MIISHAHRFVFFHNPKAGGTSVRKAIERFNDIGFGLWGADPTQTNGVEVDRAHLGIDEFAELYPDLWDQVRGYRMFCLCRDPQARFLSSISEYAKHYGGTDLRFASPEENRASVFEAIEVLSGFTDATDPGLMADIRLTHFKPQHIYWSAQTAPVDVAVFPTNEMDRFLAQIATLTGEPVNARHDKAAQTYRLPGPLNAVARARGLRKLLSRMPGKDALKRRYGAGKGRDVALGAPDLDRITTFVKTFYDADYAAWPIPAKDTP